MLNIILWRNRLPHLHQMNYQYSNKIVNFMSMVMRIQSI